MASYVMRDVDQNLWDRFRARAAADGRGLKWVILRLIALYTHAGLEPLEQAANLPATAPALVTDASPAPDGGGRSGRHE